MWLHLEAGACCSCLGCWQGLSREAQGLEIPCHIGGMHRVGRKPAHALAAAEGLDQPTKGAPLRATTQRAAAEHGG
jgi:hypothetical protein